MFLDGTRQPDGRVNTPCQARLCWRPDPAHPLLPVAILNSHRALGSGQRSSAGATASAYRRSRPATREPTETRPRSHHTRTAASHQRDARSGFREQLRPVTARPRFEIFACAPRQQLANHRRGASPGLLDDSDPRSSQGSLSDGSHGSQRRCLQRSWHGQVIYWSRATDDAHRPG